MAHMPDSSGPTDRLLTAPVLLVDPETAWLVDQGRVDVFLTRVGDGQAVALDRLDMLGPDVVQDDVVPGGREPRAEQPAHRAGANNDDLHGNSCIAK
jgi:hypothetical protein